VDLAQWLGCQWVNWGVPTSGWIAPSWRLVTRTREAQRRPVHLDAAPLERLPSWIDRYRLDAER